MGNQPKTSSFPGSVHVSDDVTPAAASTTDSDSRQVSVPVIVYLSGRRRGTTERLAEQTVFIDVNTDGGITLIPASEAVDSAHQPIRLHRSGEAYELEVQPSRNVWVNGEKVGQRTLSSGDVLEIGRNGPMLRFRIYAAGEAPHRTTADAFTDCIDCARYTDGSFAKRSGRFMSGMAGELVVRTTFWFRVVVVTLLVALVISTVFLSRQSQYLEERLEQEASRMQGISELLQRSEREAITSDDLVDLRVQLEKRVEALEARSEAARNIIAEASKSIVFLQGSYGYVEKETDKPLRYVGIGPDGQPLRAPVGPAVTLEGDGPVVEIQYTGTAFVVNAQDVLLTNRHVALPWENNPAHERFVDMGLTPKFQRFIGYLPGVEKAFDVQLITASDDADVAVLRCDEAPSEVRLLSPQSSPARPGDEVIVMGYPTGIRAMLARTDTKFLDALREEGNLDFWAIVERLAESGRITPIATRGIVGQVTPEAVVYDAETTRGGSGGPVLDMRGEVIAVNAAILPEFGGSNLGVPIARALPILEQILATDN